MCLSLVNVSITSLTVSNNISKLFVLGGVIAQFSEIKGRTYFNFK